MTDWRLTTVEQLLCDCVQVHDLPKQRSAANRLVETLGAEAAFQLAERNEVASHVAHALGDQATPEFNAVHESISDRLTAFLRELDRVAELLDQAGIPLVALKNSGIARGIYTCLGCSPMGDLDVMVRKRDFREAHRLLLQDGFQLEFRSKLEDCDIEAAEQSGGAEYWKNLPSGEKLWFELQWRPVAGRWIQPSQEPDSQVLMSRSVTLPETKVRLLSPEDNLLQVALHTAKHTYVRAPGFRLHTDVDRIVTLQEIDWARFLQRVQAARLCTSVYFSLRLARDLLGTPIPDSILQALQPPHWKRTVLSRWIRRAGILDPHRRKFGRVQYVAFVTLLYDDWTGVTQAVFPGPAQMRARYGETSSFGLPGLYLRRLWDLLIRRENT